MPNFRDNSTVETELEAPESSNRITGHAPLSAGTRSHWGQECIYPAGTW